MPEERVQPIERLALAALVATAALAYAGYALLRHMHIESTGLDLGLFDQAIWHYSLLEWPWTSIGGRSNLLGDHFHPILITLAPIYWVWSSPSVLLIAQGVLIAASIVPVHRFARRRLETGPALLIAAAYAFFWGIQSAVAADFHEVAFAPLLIALAIDYGDRERWARFAIAVVLLLLVKESFGIFVFFGGLFLGVRGQRQSRGRLMLGGAALALAGAGWFVLASEVLIPHFSDSGRFAHWYYQRFGDSLSEALWTVIQRPGLVVEVFIDPFGKVETTLLTLGAFAGLPLLSPLVLLVLPLLAERMLSDDVRFWSVEYHYSLAVAPVLAMAAADGLARLLRRLGERYRRWTGFALGAAALGASFGISTGFPLAELADPDLYSRTAKDHYTRALLDRVPPRASIVAQNSLVPHLSRRDAIFLTSPNMPDAEYIVVDYGGGHPTPARSVDSIRRMVEARLDRYRYVAAPGSVVLLRRVSIPPRRLLASDRPRPQGAEQLERDLAGLLHSAEVGCGRNGDNPRSWDCAVRSDRGSPPATFAVTRDPGSGCWLGVSTGNGELSDVVMMGHCGEGGVVRRRPLA